MTTVRLKLLIWALLLGLMAVVAWWGISSAANLLAYFERGANPAAALNIVPNVPPDLHVDLQWLPDPPDPGRPLDPFARDDIQSAYLRAWLQINLSYARREPWGLKTYFVGPAYEAVRNSIRRSVDDRWSVSQVDTRHLLQLHFFSADGSISSFTDQGARVSHLIRDEHGNVVFSGESQSTYDVVMYLEDGNWRVRHWVRVDGKASEGGRLVPAAPRRDFIGLGEGLQLNGEPFEMTGAAYNPPSDFVDDFWSRYEPKRVERDLQLVRSLGLKGIAISIPFEEFGRGHLDPTLRDRLADLLKRAGTYGLKAVITLFEGRTEYGLLRWPEADSHAKALAGHFKDYPQIAAWVLKHEPERHDASHSAETVDAWLRHAARVVREVDPNHLITITWGSAEAATRLVDSVDFVSFDAHGSTSELVGQFEALRRAGLKKTIVVQGLGTSTWRSFFFPSLGSERRQAAYYDETLAALRQQQCSGAMSVALYDSDYVPAIAPSRVPWRKASRRRLGLLRADGSKKRAATLLGSNGARSAGPAGWLDLIAQPFSATLAALTSILALLFSPRGRQVLSRARARLRRKKTPEGRNSFP